MGREEQIVTMKLSWEQTKQCIRWDVYRNLEQCSRRIIIKEILKNNSTVGTLICYRMCHYFSNLERKNIVQKFLHGICYLRFKSVKDRCGIELNQHTEIGYGLRLPHKGGIVIHPLAKIGNLCEIMQGVTIGNNIMKSRDDVAIIGDKVMLCAGAKIIGDIRIGNVVVVGANAVVTKNIADNTIVGGVPAKILGTCDDRFVINQNLDE